MLVTYVQPKLQIQVYSEGRLKGHIKQDGPNQYYYQPRGAKIKGDYFNTIAEVKRSIEQD